MKRMLMLSPGRAGAMSTCQQKPGKVLTKTGLHWYVSRLRTGTSDDKDKKIVLLESASHDDYYLSLQNIIL